MKPGNDQGRRTWRGIRLGFMLCLLTGCQHCHEPIRFPTHIAFQSNRDGVDQIYIMNTDGSGLKRLTNDTFQNEQPMVSALGLKVAFRSNRSGTGQIWSMLGDGSGLIQLTSSMEAIGSGRWGANGRIAFSGALANSLTTPDIFTMRADGTDMKRLTKDPADDIEPAYSPDGQKIAFTSTRNGFSDVFIMNADGSHLEQLTTSREADAQPSFSPDGKKIAFWSRRTGNGEIFIMNTDGTGVVNLTNNPALDFEPIFSPDTNEIAFMSERDGNREIYVMNADGSNVRRLTNNPAADGAPDWR